MSDIVRHSGSGSRLVGRQELATIMPPIGSPTWKPIQHIELVESMESELSGWGIHVKREQLAVSSNGLKLFGTMTLDIETKDQSYGAVLGFHHGNDKSIALKVVAGAQVFVCDNLALSGQAVLVYSKHSRGLYLRNRLHQALGNYFEQFRAFEDSVDLAKRTSLTDDLAKRMLFDLFYEGALSPVIMAGVGNAYFKADEQGFEDCSPRNVWGLHNAITRNLKDYSPFSQAKQTMGVSPLTLVQVACRN